MKLFQLISCSSISKLSDEVLDPKSQEGKSQSYEQPVEEAHVEDQRKNANNCSNGDNPQKGHN